MDWFGLIINIISIFGGLFLYLLLMRTKWAQKESRNLSYLVLLIAIIAACVLGFLLRVILNHFGIGV